MGQRIETKSAAIKELSELIAALLESIRRLPPGQERHAALKELHEAGLQLETGSR